MPSPSRPPVDPRFITVVSPAPREGGADAAARAVHLRTARGTPVHAVFDGEVLCVSHLTSAGLAVDLVDATGRRVASYGHLLRLARDVRDGTIVQAGQLLGWVGDTGEPAPGEFALHFSLREVPSSGLWWQGTPLDPEALVLGAER